mmetsp:Transcript_51095/g.127225  ORF Transcript_51095/g.127225 Transcript_51095/m.127225 type:complete len:277 (+) Transcript_51095:54-884(+)
MAGKKAKLSFQDRIMKLASSRWAIVAVIVALTSHFIGTSQGRMIVLRLASKLNNTFGKSLQTNLSHPTGSLVGWFVTRLMEDVNTASILDLITRADLRPGDTAMEVCFGPGKGLEELVLYGGVEVIGVDRSDEMHSRASQRVLDHIAEGRVRLLNASVDDIPGVRDGSVDKVLSMNCVYFWPSLSDSFREVYRVMKPGGLFATGAKFSNIREFDDEIFRNKDQQAILDALTEAGFVDVHANEVRISTGCPGKNARSGCKVDPRSHYTGIYATKPVR